MTLNWFLNKTEDFGSASDFVSITTKRDYFS